jgi:spermidine synthase
VFIRPDLPDRSNQASTSRHDQGVSRRRSEPSGSAAEPLITPVGLGIAELVADPDRPSAWTLFVDGTPQSHVDLLDPTYLEFEYVRWLGHVSDLAAGPGPLNVLHLGGGAWTLGRYLAATRPGSRQRVVELDSRLVEFVRARLPSEGNGIRVRIGDAREVLSGLSPDSVDLIVVDVFAGARIPAHLTSTEFVAEAARVLRPTGTYAANLADGPPLTFVRGQAATVSAVFTEIALISSAQVLRGRRFGNFLLVAGQGRLPVADLARRTAADPFPARVVTGPDLVKFIAGAKAVTDAVATRSPSPPPGLMGL